MLVEKEELVSKEIYIFAVISYFYVQSWRVLSCLFISRSIKLHDVLIVIL